MADRKTAKRRGPTTVILFNKPFNVLSQFTDDKPATPTQSRQVLADFIDIPDVYPCGRLDRDSEGLIVLTNNGKLQARISNPASKLEKSYLAQVEGDVDEQALQRLRNGITLKDGPAQASGVLKTAEPAWLWPRNPPIRQRQSIPTSWLQLSLTEGRNRQVRRMTAHIGFPTLRLVRISVGEWTLGNLQPGDWRTTSAGFD